MEPTLTNDNIVTQGGDWGFMITRTIGAMYPKHCKGSHMCVECHSFQLQRSNNITTSNLIIAAPPTFTQNPLYALRHMLTPYTDAEKAGLARTAWFRGSGTGYSALQTTKPQTLGYGLASSPVFLLAWIYEKLHDWTDSYPWTDEEICTWISIYWFSAAGPAASVRIYYEVTHIPTPTLEKMSGGKHGWNAMSSLKTPQVPLGLARFPKELGVFPKVWTYPLGNVVYESESKDGGHFAAWEKPDVIAADLQKMFGKGGPCFGAVKGRNGY